MTPPVLTISLIVFPRRDQELRLSYCRAEWRPDSANGIALCFVVSTNRSKTTIFHKFFFGGERTARGYFITFSLVMLNCRLKILDDIECNIKCKGYPYSKRVRLHYPIGSLRVIYCIVEVHNWCPLFWNVSRERIVWGDLVNFKASYSAAPSLILAERIEKCFALVYASALIFSVCGGRARDKAA